MEQGNPLGSPVKSPEPTVPSSPEKSCCSKKAKVVLIVSAVVFVAAISSVSAYFLAKSRLPTPAASPTPIIQASPTPLDETANWKTYTISNKITFKYPPNLFVKETTKDLVVILPEANTPPQNAEISIDARAANTNLRLYNEAINIYKNEILRNATVVPINNGVRISGTLGPGYGEGKQVTTVLFKNGQGAIAVDYSGNPNQIATFDQILSTFKFLKDTPVSTTLNNNKTEITEELVYALNGTGIEFLIQDTEGKQIGYTTDGSMVSTITGATYTQVTDSSKMIVIPNPIAGKYLLRIVGLKSGGNFGGAGYILTTGDTLIEFTGTIKQGETKEYPHQYPLR